MTARRGFSLAEVIVAMTLLSIVGLAVAATGFIAAQAFTQSEMRERVVRAAENVLDSLQTLDANGAGVRRMQGAQIGWAASDSTAAISVRIDMPGMPAFDLRGER